MNKILLLDFLKWCRSNKECLKKITDLEIIELYLSKNELDLQKRKIEFYNLIGQKYLQIYDKEFLLDFCNYWTEHNEGGKKMRFEHEKIFNIERRLLTFKNNNNKFTHARKNQSTSKITDGDILDAVRKSRQQ